MRSSNNFQTLWRMGARGQPSTSSNAERDLRKAWALLTDLHEGPPCRRVLWKRMPSTGVANDLNNVVRSFAIAVRGDRQGRVADEGVQGGQGDGEVEGELTDIFT